MKTLAFLSRFVMMGIVLCLMLHHSVPAYAVTDLEGNVIRITNSDGLSSGAVNSLYQDSRGLLWIGTWDGLNCYDGAKMRVLRPHFSSHSGLSNPVVRRVFEDDEGLMWIATDYGINRYNCYDGTFDNYYLAYEGKVIFCENAFDVCRSESNEIIATAYNSGIYHFNREENRFHKITLPNELPEVGVLQIFFDSNGRLWIVYKRSMVCCDFELAERRVKLSVAGTVALEDDLQAVIYDDHDRVWLQDTGGQVSYVSIHAPFVCRGVRTMTVRIHDVLYRDGSYYFGTGNGVLVYRGEELVKTHFEGLAVLSLLFSTQDILWAGSDMQGLFGVLPQKRYFTSYRADDIPELGMYAVRAIFKDVNGNLWVGTKGGGLLRVSQLADATRRQVWRYTTEDGLPSNSVFALAAAGGGDFWVGCDGSGLRYYSHKERTLVSPAYIGSGTPPDIYSVYAILQRDTTLWVGTSGNGLFRLDLARQNGRYVVRRYRHYTFGKGTDSLSSNIIYSLSMPSDSMLWIATRGGGLNLLHTRRNEVTVFKNNADDKYSISCNDVISVYTDSHGNVWAGTTNGLNHLVGEPSRWAFFRMGVNNGLSSNYIHSILEDSIGQLWVSTNRGISRINPHDQSVVRYYVEDGLQGNEFSDGAALSTAAGGVLYFGGSNGFTVFNPSDIGVSNYKPALYLSSYNVNNEPRPLQPSYATPLRLDYTENSLDFHFSVIEFISNSKCLLSYRILRDNDKKVKRISVDDAREVILSNLAPGNYCLEVSYTNADNHLYEAAFLFPFVIKPPWWASVYAYWAYALIVICILLFVFLTQRRKIMQRHSREIEALERAKEAEIHEAKLRFFTNIAHEFSNSITLIYGPCERIIRNGKIDVTSRNYLKVIRRNAERMQRLIQQLMDFRKAETGHLALRFEETDVAEIVRYSLDYFTEIAEEKKMEVRFEPSQPSVMWVVDRDSMEKIVFNLLSNAFKYAPAEGHVYLTLGIEAGGLRLTCSNNGKRIKPDDQHAIFDRFKVLDNFENKLSQGIFPRNGVGLAMCKDLAALMNGSISVESTEEGETTFTVTVGSNAPTETDVLQSATLPIAYASSPTGLTALVVDDESEIRSFVSEILSHKYTVIEAVNGKDALEKMREQMPDIVICDVVMPVMDGIALLNAIKRDDRTKHVPVIMLTSRSTIESQIEGLEQGADMYIGKPFHPEYLLAAVDRVLGNVDIMKEYAQSPQAYTEQYKGKVIDRLDKEFLDKLVEVLRHNIANEEFFLEMLAAELAVSRVQLYRKIKQITSSTPSEFIRNFRLQEAEKLLRTTSHTVSEIMDMCGFQNKSYFYREFAKMYDATPKEYRKRCNGES